MHQFAGRCPGCFVIYHGTLHQESKRREHNVVHNYYSGTLVYNVIPLCHKWDHRSCLIIKISHASTLATAWYCRSILHLGVSTKTSPLQKKKNQTNVKLQQSILYFCCSSFSSSDRIIIIITPLPEGTFSWHTAHEPNENFYLRGAGGGVFAPRACRDLIWMCLMCAWNSKCQPGGRWVGMRSEASRLNAGETAK